MENKKYYAVNETLNKEISQIKNKIMLSMNGICAEKMQESGINYTKNFGVSWNRLCEIASSFEQNYDLAIRLWMLDIRETKLIATKICPPEMLDETNLNDWISEINNPELAEISAIMFAKNTKLKKNYISLLQDENFFIRLCMLHTLCKTIAALNTEETDSILNSINISDTDNISASRAIESFLYNLNMAGYCEKVKSFLEKLDKANTKYSTSISNNLIY